MGFFKKLGDLARSNINNLLDQMEDPKKMAELAIIELEEGKKKAQTLLIRSQSRIRLLEQKMLKLRDDAAQLLKEAEILLTQSDEEKARAVLEKKQTLTQEKSFYEQELKTEEQAVATIKRGLLAIDEKVKELKLSAKNIGMNIIQKADAFDGFARMEEKIEMGEHEIDALKELFELDKHPKKEADELTASFDKHSDPEALEKELLAIKKKLS